MRGVILYSLFFFIFCGSLMSQFRKVKPIKTHLKMTNFAFSAGYTKSVLFLSRNVKENNDAKGLTFGLIYGGAKIFRTSLEYTYFRPIKIDPTWTDIKAYTLESNVHVITKVKDGKAIFYPLFGLSLNHFSGFFTGKNDFLNLAEKYKTNTVVTTNWLGINVGTGYEQYFGPASFFIDYKMRVGFKDDNHRVNIMDICIGFGLRYTIKVPTLYKILSSGNRYDLEPVKH